jgi:hypothetical protein
MNSYENLNGYKYFGKIAIIFIIVFLVIKFIINLKPYEAMLLTCIIVVSILIIENLFYINSQSSDPLNCDQCKINLYTSNEDNSTKNNVEPFMNLDSMSSNINSINSTIDNSINSVGKIIKDSMLNVAPIKDKINDISANLNTNVNNIINNSIKTITPEIKNVEPPVMSTESKNINDLDSYIEEQNNINHDIIKNKQLNETINPVQEMNNNQQPIMTNMREEENNNLQSMNINQLPITSNIFEENNNITPPIDPSFDVGYVNYQKDGLQKIEDEMSEKNALFRASIGNQDVVRGFFKDGNTFYNSIYTVSTDAPKTYESLNSEMKYGNYNYIAPLNKGMINKEYTFISPTNWYPIPPHPPVCVTNKNCITSPVLISDGKDYMNFANLEDFDNARRFTGDMNINIDYIKNVLNNPNSY